MITSIEIDGFKSLRNFKMDFRPGLNVLAGPNGSGKTNILQALEFLTRIQRGDVNDAIKQSIQDFGSIFSRIGLEPIMKFSIYGNSDSIESLYHASFTIQKKDGRFCFTNWNLVVDDFAVENIVGFYPDASDMYFENFIKQPYSDEHFVPNSLSKDLLFIKYFDIQPTLARKTGSIDVYEVVEKSGAGLCETIYTIVLGKYYHHVRVKETDLLDYFNLLPIKIGQIKPEVRTASREVDINFILAYNNEEISIKSVSDGEVTWLTLSVCLLFYHSYSLAFDEPDRHLHPDMLMHMVTLFREHAEKGPGWLLMTTHNQTVLNQLEPEELLLVESVDGSTRVRPINNIEKFKEDQYEEGRGLGYYYVAGAL